MLAGLPGRSFTIDLDLIPTSEYYSEDQGGEDIPLTLRNPDGALGVDAQLMFVTQGHDGLRLLGLGFEVDGTNTAYPAVATLPKYSSTLTIHFVSAAPVARFLFA